MSKCPGCRCTAPTTNRRCACCRAWPDALPCVSCGQEGRFDTDLILTKAGPIHDSCARKCALTVPGTFVACGEGGNFCSETCQLRDEVKKLKDVLREAKRGLKHYGRHDGTWVCRERGCGVVMKCDLDAIISMVSDAIGEQEKK